MKKNKIVRIFNLYNLAIFACIILMIGSIWIIFKPEKKVTPSGIELVNTGVKEKEQITEKKAKEVALKQFKKLGEKNVTEEKLKIEKIRRNQEEYYYICSLENTMEIKIDGGKITRINSASVEV